MGMRPSAPRWHRSPARSELLALYAEADALLDGWTCECSTGPGPEGPRCCQFAVTGREPYPTAVELEEVRHAMRAAGIAVGAPSSRTSSASRSAAASRSSSTPPPRRLPLTDARGLAGARPCPLLSADGRCRIYASRPLGCRTYFCQGAEAPYGARTKAPRDAVNAIGRRIADLSARFDPRDPQPRALTKSIA
jgi:Fe-S-cluster containining protein